MRHLENCFRVAGGRPVLVPTHREHPLGGRHGLVAEHLLGWGPGVEHLPERGPGAEHLPGRGPRVEHLPGWGPGVDAHGRLPPGWDLLLPPWLLLPGGCSFPPSLAHSPTSG